VDDRRRHARQGVMQTPADERSKKDGARTRGQPEVGDVRVIQKTSGDAFGVPRSVYRLLTFSCWTSLRPSSQPFSSLPLIYSPFLEVATYNIAIV
jgi:hypothetical protein